MKENLTSWNTNYLMDGTCHIVWPPGFETIPKVVESKSVLLMDVIPAVSWQLAVPLLCLAEKYVVITRQVASQQHC